VDAHHSVAISKSPQHGLVYLVLSLLGAAVALIRHHNARSRGGQGENGRGHLPGG